MTVQIVWFKRDLRIADHAALAGAVENGPVIPLYVTEPELWRQPDMSGRQYDFLLEGLDELTTDLKAAGCPLVTKTGDVVEVLDSICEEHQVSALWSHQETWNGWTYQRDKLVVRWAKSRGIPWHEPGQNGIIRVLKNRNGWSEKWRRQMSRPIAPTPQKISGPKIKSDPIPTLKELKLEEGQLTERQPGGRSHGLTLLKTFLHERGEGYATEMSSPLTAFDSCSRLSAHLAFGTISMREVYQATEARRDELREMAKEERGKWLGALKTFSARLRWHCHFSQKLEDEPRIEFENFHSGYDGLREPHSDQKRFDAWKTGMTGYPMVDACMRALIATGWINFRMRAMLMSFSSYHLWLHWREPSLHLARLFVDYEPGIHYSQAQMQSGTTGINTYRIYNPIKQGYDHDPAGEFIKKWVPELRELPDLWIHEPWNAPELANGYPPPIVDEKAARKEAASKLYALKKSPKFQKEAKNIVQKHGSRKRRADQPS